MIKAKLIDSNPILEAFGNAKVKEKNICQINKKSRKTNELV
jgi:hypothetical protein